MVPGTLSFVSYQFNPFVHCPLDIVSYNTELNRLRFDRSSAFVSLHYCPLLGLCLPVNPTSSGSWKRNATFYNCKLRKSFFKSRRTNRYSRLCNLHSLCMLMPAARLTHTHTWAHIRPVWQYLCSNQTLN